MKWIIIGAGLFVAAVVLMLVQLWFSAMNGALFVKIELTLAALLMVEATLWFIMRELRDYRRQLTSSTLDGE